MNALEIAGLSHDYDGHPALSNVSVSVDAGELFCILGPNGSGKSTLFKCLSTLLKPASGTITVSGGISLLDQPSQARRQIGTVFQEPVLDPELTVRENLDIAAALYGLSRTVAAKRISEFAPILGIEDRLQTRVSRLSGGLVRRADLLRGFLHHPAILLLDEPTAGLDPAARHRFWTAIEAVRGSSESTILFTSHLMEEADRADRLMILNAGQVVAVGTSTSLREQAKGERILVTSSRDSEIEDWLRNRFDVEIRPDVDGLYVVANKPDELFRAIHAEWDDALLELTIRKPSLEDIFFERTGNRWDTAEPVANSTEVPPL